MPKRLLNAFDERHAQASGTFFRYDYQGRCIDLRSIVYHNRLFGSNNNPKLGYKIDVRD
ncbi:MAG: hypothetical protein KJP15_08415 [Gammaproteobacteria bacterium]|nr:hypothetical protein [Gammaproteobacteria bacterium]